MDASHGEKNVQEEASCLGSVVSGSERVLTPKEFAGGNMVIKNEPQDVTIARSPTSQSDTAITVDEPVSVIAESTEGKKYATFNQHVQACNQHVQARTQGITNTAGKSQCGCVIELLTKEGNERRTRDYAETVRLVENGPPKLDKSRWMFLKTPPYGNMQWITACAKNHKFYCWPCLLFSNYSNLWNDKGIGFKHDLRKLFASHENTSEHLYAEVKLKIMEEMIEKSKSSIEKQIKKTGDSKSVLDVFRIAALLIQAKQEGYLDTTYLLQLAEQREDDMLMNIRYLHRDVITCLNRALTEHIEHEIQQALFYSCTIDTNEQSQLLATARFVSSTGELTDRFIKVFHQNSNMSNVIQELKGLGGSKSIMVALCMGNVADIDSSILSEPGSHFITLHSPNHRISQVLPTAFKCIKECVLFFLSMQGLSSLISHCPEWIISEFPDIKLTEWKENLIVTTHKNKEHLISKLKSNSLKTGQKSGEAYTISLGLCKAFEEQEFSFLLRVFAELIPIAENLLDELIIANKDVPLFYKVKETTKNLRKKTEIFWKIWLDSINKESENDVDGPPKKRPRQVGSQKLLNYYKQLYEQIITIFSDFLEKRFSAINHTELITLINGCVRNRLSFQHKTRGEDNVDTWINKTDRLRLKNEIRGVIKYKDLYSLTIDQMMIRMEKSNMAQTVPEIMKVLRLLLVIPYVSTSNQASQIQLLKNAKALKNSPFPDLLQLHSDQLINLIDTRDFTKKLLHLFSNTHVIEFKDNR